MVVLGRAGTLSYWGLTAGAEKHLGSKSWGTVQTAMGNLGGSHSSPLSPPNLCWGEGPTLSPGTGQLDHLGGPSPA